MKKILIACKPLLNEVVSDAMLIACIVGPIFMGIAFKFLVPLLEIFLCSKFSQVSIIAPYYSGLDVLLSFMTPVMFTFAGTMIILDELDSKVAKYYFVTPIGKLGYIISRIVIPGVVGFIFTLVLLLIFSVSDMNFLYKFFIAVGGFLMSVITSLFVIAFANNKMEGLALVKMSGLFFVGIVVSYFVSDPIRYVFSFMPTFWIAELCYKSNLFMMIPMVVTSFLFIGLLFSKFTKKLR